MQRGQMNDSIINIRAHHLLCLQGFQGYGYSQDFVRNMAEIIKKIGKTTEAYKSLIEGKLPPGQIDARSRRYAVKLFLSHLQLVWYEKHYGEKPPLPYPIAILGHAHMINSPH